MTPSIPTNSLSRESKEASLTLTPRQVQILRFIRAFRSNNGYSPTLQEMALNLQVSKVTVFEHVEALVQKGLLLRKPNKARSLTIDPQCENHPALVSGDASVSSDFDSQADLSHPACYPLAGDIAAGSPLEAIENPDFLDLSTMFETRDGTFALQVRGESMIDEHIRDGDYVLVEATRSVRDGQIAVALLENGEATLKKVYRCEQGFRLEGANPNFHPIYVDQLNIQGVVIGVVRRY